VAAGLVAPVRGEVRDEVKAEEEERVDFCKLKEGVRVATRRCRGCCCCCCMVSGQGEEKGQ